MNISLIVAIVLIIIYSLLNIFLKCSKEKKNLIFLRIAFIIIFIILCIREPFSDLEGYISSFYRLNISGFDEIIKSRLEPAYKILIVIIGKIWLNERFYMFAVDFISCLGPYYFIKKYSKNYLLSILLFIAIGTYRMNFYLIRQAIAVSLLLFSIKYVENKKIIPFTLLVMLAGLFHKSALIFIVLYFMCNNRLEKNNKFIFPSIAILCYMYRKEICNLALKIEYSWYADTIYAVSGEGYSRLAIFVLLLIFSLLLKKKNTQYDKQNDIMLNISLIAILIQILASNIAIISRVAYYFSMGFIILPVNSIAKLESKYTKMVISLVTIMTTLLYIYLINPVVGYSFYWLN